MEYWTSLSILLAQQEPVAEPAVPNETITLLMAGAVVLAVLLVLWIVFQKMRRRPELETDVAPNLRLDVTSLAMDGPPAGKPYLEFYSVPVRLAVVVLAPVGRDGALPSNDHLPLVMEAILPGLMKVLTAHQPKFVRWPAQLSTQGFAHAFFNNVPLPGDHGRGTPWCSIAGKVELAAGQFLVGLVCCSAEPNSLGEVIAKHAAGWPDVVRVKG